MDEKLYRFRVNHTVHGEVEVLAPSRYQAVVNAVKEWGLRWTTIAKDCIVIQLGNSPVRKGGRHG